MISAILAFVRRMFARQQDSIAIEQQRRQLLTAQRVADEQYTTLEAYLIARSEMAAHGIHQGPL
jgi:small-conductance mechanosensitive channel